MSQFWLDAKIINKNTESEIWFSQFGLFHTNSLTRNSTILVSCITLRLSLAKRVNYIYQNILTSTPFIFLKSGIHFPLSLHHELNSISFHMYKPGLANTSHNFKICRKLVPEYYEMFLLQFSTYNQEYVNLKIG